MEKPQLHGSDVKNIDGSRWDKHYLQDGGKGYTKEFRQIDEAETDKFKMFIKREIAGQEKVKTGSSAGVEAEGRR